MHLCINGILICFKPETNFQQGLFMLLVDKFKADSFDCLEIHPEINQNLAQLVLDEMNLVK